MKHRALFNTLLPLMRNEGIDMVNDFRWKDAFNLDRQSRTHPTLKNEIKRSSPQSRMDMDTAALVLLGFTTGVCIGAVLVMLRISPRQQHTDIQKIMFSQRDSLRSLRLEFNKFRDNHERELLNILRETLRTSPRSVVSHDDEPNATS
jgi:hypothetical protein